MVQNKKSNFQDQNQNDAGGDAGGGLKIGLKGSAAPDLGAIRNPMIGGINPGKVGEGEKPAAQPPQNPVKSPEGQQKKPQQPEVSSIKGLSESTSVGRSQATVIGQAMIAPSSGKGRYIKWIILVVILGAIGYAAAVEDVRNKVIDTYKSVKDQVVGTVRYQPKKGTKNTSKILYDQAEKQKKVPVVTAPRKSAANRSCQALVSGTSGSGNIPVNDRVDLAECYLMIDDYTSAELNLNRMRAQLISAPEAKINTPKASRNLADAYLTLTTIYAVQGKYREASELTRGKCQRWTVSNSCVARAILTALRGGPAGVDPGANALFQTTGGLDRKAQARLWWAGGLLAEKEKNRPVADQRFTLAMKTVPSDAIALKKNIYESYAVNLFNRSEMIKLNAVVSRAMGDLSRIDRKAKVKLQTLQSLASTRNKTATVRALLSSENVAFRARSDAEMMEILGASAIATQQADGYLQLAKKSREFYKTRKYESHPYERNLSQWEIRMHLSKGEYETALAHLGSYETKVGKDLFIYHLRGVVYHLMSTDPRFQIQAAGEFQNALRIKKNWETLYALGITLLRGNKLTEAATVLKDLERMIKTRGQKYWLEMLKAEWYMAKEKYLNAEKILLDWSRQETEYFMPRQLLMDLYKRQGRSADEIRVETELVEINRSKRFDTSFEGFASPLGYMAVGERPID